MPVKTAVLLNKSDLPEQLGKHLADAYLRDKAYQDEKLLRPSFALRQMMVAMTQLTDDFQGRMVEAFIQVLNTEDDSGQGREGL